VEISCRVTGKNGEAIDAGTSVDWHFGGGGFGIDSSFHSDTWTGPLVTGGAIQAQATINGVRLTGERGLKVNKRNWDSKTIQYSPPFDTLINSSTQYRPRQLRDLAYTDHGARVALDTIASGNNPQTVAIVQSGPNAGLTYFLEIPMVARMKVFIARGAFVTGSTWYNLQTPGPAAYPPSSQCTQGDIPNFVPLMEQHEGLPNGSGQYPQASHTGLFSRTLLSEARKRTESMVFKYRKWANPQLNRIEFRRDVTPALQAVVNRALDESDKMDRLSQSLLPYAAIPFCNFIF
jgi:hypothetical protein